MKSSPISKGQAEGGTELPDLLQVLCHQGLSPSHSTLTSASLLLGGYNLEILLIALHVPQQIHLQLRLS